MMNVDLFLLENSNNNNKMIRVNTENNSAYLYSENENQFLYSPNVDKGNYRRKKESFLVLNGFMDDYSPDFIIDYDKDRLKANLANLRMLVIEVTD